MKKHRCVLVVIAGLFALAFSLGSCSLFGIDGPTYLGVDWEGGFLWYDWNLPYPFNDNDLWLPQTFYEIEPDTYFFQYDLPDYFYSSPYYTLEIIADSGSFPFKEGKETYFALLLMDGGPELYYSDRMVARVYESDGSWTATARQGGRTVTLGYKAGGASPLDPSTQKSSKTK